MSTSTISGRRPRNRVGFDYRTLLWAVTAAWIVILAWGLVSASAAIRNDALSLTPWIVLLTVIHLLPLEGWQSAQLVADWPIETAAALLLSPIETGIVGFVSAIDPREFRGQIAFPKALFNRSQVGLTYFLGSFVVHHVVASPGNSKLILPLAFLVLAVVVTANYVLVGVEISLEHGYGFGEVVRHLRLGTPLDFLLTFAGWSVLGAMLAALYARIHPLALLAFLAPTLLGRQVLIRSQMLVDTSRAYQSRGRALAHLEHQMHEERSDERKLIAADLHDEVLQPLFKVTLMAHVLKADLASGRLLDIDNDLPELIVAAELASSILRELIGDLRRSSLGRGGLPTALEHLVQGAESRSRVRIQRRIDRVPLDAARELVVYQIAKEALSNALAHSQATQISVDLRDEGDTIVLSVKDNGVGFDPVTGREGHYGLHIMRERATAVGGQLLLDSFSGQGSSVVLLLRSD